MKGKFLLMYSWAVRTSLFFLPDIPVFMRFRGFMYSLGMKSCGLNFQVTHDVIIKGVLNFAIGKNVFIANRSMLMGSGSITIEDEVLIGPNCVIVSGVHTLLNGSFRYGRIEKGSVLISHGSWICANSTIGMGAVLPRGSVLGANSFLSKELSKEFSVYGGSPAKFIKSIHQ